MSKLNYFGNGSGNKTKQTESKGHRIKSQTHGAFSISDDLGIKDLSYTKCPNCDESEYIGYGSGSVNGKSRKCRCVECGEAYDRKY